MEKTSDKAVQHFSTLSWLLKNSFKTKEELLRISFWYYYYLSTEIDNIVKKKETLIPAL
jgi:hypothetical protein